jgi:hypothetical protein
MTIYAKIAICLGLAAGFASSMATAGETWVAPRVQPVYKPISPALQDERPRVVESDADRDFDSPLIDRAEAEKKLRFDLPLVPDQAEAERKLEAEMLYPVRLPDRGMQLGAVVMKPAGWWEQEQQAKADRAAARKQARKEAERKKDDAKRRHARAARTAAQVRAGL